MKYTMGIMIMIFFIVLCGVASAQSTSEMQDRSNQIAANVTMLIVSSVQNQQQNGMINSSSFNSITNDAVITAINQMAETNPDIQPINETTDYFGVPKTTDNQTVNAVNDNQTTDNDTSRHFVITFESAPTNITYIDSILNIIDNWKIAI
jgi:hypothetical protein